MEMLRLDGGIISGSHPRAKRLSALASARVEKFSGTDSSQPVTKQAAKIDSAMYRRIIFEANIIAMAAPACTHKFNQTASSASPSPPCSASFVGWIKRNVDKLDKSFGRKMLT